MGFFLEWVSKLRKRAEMRGYTCDMCGAEIFTYPTDRLCAKCEKQMVKNDCLTCFKCGRPTRAEGVCLDCKDQAPAFTFGYSPFVYGGNSAALVNRMKNGEQWLARYFGERMADEIAEQHPELFQTPPLVIPVPLTKERLKERGYNQAERLAEAIVHRLTAKGIDAETDAQLLLKIRETGQQKHMGRRARAENAAGAYHVHKRKECKGRVILLIDDIMTTGATGSACAEKLLKAGASLVVFLVATAIPEGK